MVSCADERWQNTDTQLAASLHVLQSAAVRRIGEETRDAPGQEAGSSAALGGRTATRVAVHVLWAADADERNAVHDRGPRMHVGVATGTMHLPARISTARRESRDKEGMTRP
jgi:hypothetical protein